MQSSESLGVLTLIFPSAPVVQGWTTACDWLEAPLLGHSPCHRFIESCPQGVLRTIRVVIQPESSGWPPTYSRPVARIFDIGVIFVDCGPWPSARMKNWTFLDLILPN